MDELLITCYSKPDLDGYACVKAYAEFLNTQGKNVFGAIFGEPHEEVKFLLKEYNFEMLPTANPEKFSKIILVDSSDRDGIDKRIKPEKVIEIIDHRKINRSEDFPNAEVQIEPVGAAATLIAEKFKEKDIKLSRETALLIYGAIVSNTLNFKAKVTTERDMALAKWIQEKINIEKDFAEKMFQAKSDMSGGNLQKTINGDFAHFKSHNFGGKKFGIAQIEMVGGLNLAKNRKDEINQELNKIKDREKIDFDFLTIIDLVDGRNIFVSDNRYVQNLLQKVLGVKFEKDIAIRSGLIMRKEIIPLLKEELEK